MAAPEGFAEGQSATFVAPDGTTVKALVTAYSQDGRRHLLTVAETEEDELEAIAELMSNDSVELIDADPARRFRVLSATAPDHLQLRVTLEETD
jgi:hypothetical protein